ncbi:multiple epidermal growth factor-like domains 11 isoform X2 [Pelobates cultripes]|uniref:Multiple epidermal growth factor-like domains 11 isoform X2 n=1 Tax=Pelobates cultripes TaxID=61616 RepID=A0AAD1WQU5_PELCU|nr:multiple epidermal growth factor-like domains 11 isoform X2 [Pelobates cultripes]
MIRVLIFTVLLDLSQAHDGEKDHDISSEENIERRGHCPNHGSSPNASLPECPTSCGNGTNCTAVNCTSDASCSGIQKCCDTSCGLKCIDPIYMTVCSEDEDCAEPLVCCRKRCVATCVPSNVIPPKKKKNGKSD